MFMERFFWILQPNPKLLNKFEVIPTQISTSLKIILKEKDKTTDTFYQIIRHSNKAKWGVGEKTTSICGSMLHLMPWVTLRAIFDIMM